MFGCDGSDNDGDAFEGVETQDMENRTFVFPDGRAFDLEGPEVTLDVGTFGAAGNANVASVTLTTDAGTAEGEVAVDEDGDVVNGGVDITPEAQCDVTITDSTIAELVVGQTIRFEPCEVNDADGSLRIENDATDEVSTSEAP
jgi:hypothetical protein